MADTFRAIIQQSESAKQNVEQQAQQQRASVEQQSKEAQESLRKQESELERQVQEAKKDVAEQQVMSKRQSQLAGKKEVKYEAQRQAKEILPQIEKAEAEIKAEIKATKKEVEKAKEELLKDIEADISDRTGKIEAQESELLGNLSELQKDNVELDYKDTDGNAQWVAKDFYESLDSDKQSYLNKNGLDAFKSKYYHETKDGQLIDREYYNSLSSEDKKYLDSNGLSAFNELLVDRSYEQYTELRESRGEEVQYTLEQWRNATSEFRERRLVLNQYGAYKDTALNAGGNVDDIATQQEWLDMSDDERQKAYEKMTGKFYVTLSTGDIVPENYYDSLTSEQQAQLNKLGVDGYRIANTVTLKNGELIDRTYYESLTTEQQQQINDIGVNEFQYKMYVDMATSGNASYISRTEWDARSESDRQDLINRTADLINYTIYRGNASVLGVQPMTVTEWQSQTESTRNYILTETQYNIYTNLSEGAGITPISIASYLNYTPEERNQLYELVINDGYVSSPKTGELYPKNRFNELTDKQQEAFNTGGAEGLQVVISNDLWDSMNQIYGGISSATGIQSNPYTQQQWDGMTYEQRQNAYNNTLNTYSAFILTQTNATIGQINQVTGGNVPLYTTDQWDNMDFTQQQDTYASTIDKYGDSLYKTYADNVKFINENTAQNIILLNQSDWNNLPTEQQINYYNNIVNKIDAVNEKIQQDYINSLPEDAQAYIKTNGLDNFNSAYDNLLTDSKSGKDITNQLIKLGLLPKDAKDAEISENGEIAYTSTISGKEINLSKDINFSNITNEDFINILYTLRTDDKYKPTSAELASMITPLGGSGSQLSRDGQARLNKWLSTLTDSQIKAINKALDKYGTAKFIEFNKTVAYGLFPHLEALEADVTLADVNAKMDVWDWVSEIATVVTLGIAPALTIAAKATSIKALVASLKLASLTGWTAKARAVSAFPKGEAYLRSMVAGTRASELLSSLAIGTTGLGIAGYSATSVANVIEEPSLGNNIMLGINALLLGFIMGGAAAKVIKTVTDTISSNIKAAKLTAQSTSAGGVSVRGVTSYYIQTAKTIGTSGMVADVTIGNLYNNVALAINNLAITISDSTAKVADIQKAAIALKAAASNLGSGALGTNIQAEQYKQLAEFFDKNAKIVFSNRGKIIGADLTPELTEIMEQLVSLTQEAKLVTPVDTTALSGVVADAVVTPQSEAINQLAALVKKTKPELVKATETELETFFLGRKDTIDYDLIRPRGAYTLEELKTFMPKEFNKVVKEMEDFDKGIKSELKKSGVVSKKSTKWTEEPLFEEILKTAIEVRNAPPLTKAEVAAKRAARRIYEGVGMTVNTYGYKAALEAYGKEMLLSYSPKAMEYAMAEYEFIRKQTSFWVASDYAAKRSQSELLKKIWEEGGIPDNVPSTYKLANGMTVREALIELANLEKPRLEAVYGGTVIKITPRKTKGLKLNYPLYVSPIFYGKIIDVQMGLIKGFGEDVGGVFKIFTKKDKGWTVKAENPQKNILREIRNSVKAVEYIDDTPHTISLSPSQVEQYNNLYVEVGTAGRWTDLQQQEKLKDIPKAFREALLEQEGVVTTAMYIPVDGKSLQGISEKLYYEIVKAVEDAGYIKAILIYGEGLVKAVYPNAIEAALAERLDGGYLSSGGSEFVNDIIKPVAPSGGSATLTNLSDNVVYGVDILADTNTIWQTDKNKPSAVLIADEVVVLPSSIGAIPASYLDMGIYQKDLSTVTKNNKLNLAEITGKYMAVTNIGMALSQTKSVVQEKESIKETVTVAEKTTTKSDTETMSETIVSRAYKTIVEQAEKSETKLSVDNSLLISAINQELLKIENKTMQKELQETASILSAKLANKVYEAIKVGVVQNITIVDPIKWGNFKIFKTIKLPNGKTVGFTKEQWKGKVGWKQGLFYWLIYPPYGENDKIVTRKKIAGIPYFSGIKSAYRSIIKLGGKVPYKIFRDFGIFDIEITTPRKGNKPTIKYIPDYKQKTKRTGRTVGELSSLK